MPEATLRQAINLSEDWMFLIFLFALVSLAYTRVVHPARISRLWNSMWNIRTMRQSLREEPNTPRANFLFNMTYYLLAALIVYAAIKCFRPEISMRFGSMFYPLLVLAVFLIYLIKRITLRAISILGDGDFSLSEYEFSVFLTNRTLGIILLPFTAAIVYFPVYQAQTIITASILLVFAAVLYRLIRSLLTAAESGVSPFYILFYICTLEILPTALGIKWLTTI
jgi:hypothetical protein